jgi:hypothetical protein
MMKKKTTRLTFLQEAIERTKQGETKNKTKNEKHTRKSGSNGKTPPYYWLTINPHNKDQTKKHRKTEREKNRGTLRTSGLIGSSPLT